MILLAKHSTKILRVDFPLKVTVKVWRPFAQLWAPFGSLWVPLGSLWAALGLPLALFGSFWEAATLATLLKMGRPLPRNVPNS